MALPASAPRCWQVPVRWDLRTPLNLEHINRSVGYPDSHEISSGEIKLQVTSSHPVTYWKTCLLPTNKKAEKNVTEGLAEGLFATGTQKWSKKFGCNLCSRGPRQRMLLKWKQSGRMRLIFGTPAHKLYSCFWGVAEKKLEMDSFYETWSSCVRKRHWGWWLQECVCAGASIAAWLCLQAAKTTNRPIIVVIIGGVKKMGCIHAGT